MKALRATLNNLSLAELKASLLSLYAVSAHKNILAGIDTSLVLVDGCLVNTSNGEYRQVQQEEGRSRAEQVARSAGQLLEGRELPASILLLLPPDDFIATHFAMGISGDKILRSALKLQAHTLIPAYEDELMLAINGSDPEGVALWFPARNANAWFLAFQEQELRLAALMPRTLALLQTNPAASEQILIDEDERHSTQLEYRDGVIRALLSISQIDLQQEAFASQWQAECDKLSPAPKVRSTGLAFWTGLRQVIQGLESYCFFPAGAEKVGRDLIARKQRAMGGIAAALFVFVLCIPFIVNWFQIQRMERIVNELREASTDARQSQAAVFAMEEEWGAISDFPRQDVAQILLTLNELIDSSLSNFTIDKGVVDITGFAQDPALLIEQLAEREEFYDVGQSRSSSGDNSTTRGDRFGIRFNISNLDFAGYEEQYPASEEE